MRYLLVDRITELQKNVMIRGARNVAMSEDFLAFHFPDNPVMPGALLLEGLVQLAGWLEAESTLFEKWMLLHRVRRCRYYGFARPGDQVRLEVRSLPSTEAEFNMYRGIGTDSNGKKLIDAAFEGVLKPLSTLHDPSRAKRLFQILTGNSGFDPNG